jgi:hypothetical protein
MSITDEQKQALLTAYAIDRAPRKEAPLAWVGPFGKVRYNFTRIGREMFQVQELPQGALPIYDRDPDITEEDR